MLRITDKETSLNFFVNALGLKEVRTIDVEEGRFSLIFLAAEGNEESQIELTHNWDGDDLGNGSRNFGHLAYEVDNIYEVCKKLQDKGVTINRPPRDGRMAFVKSPDNISIEILQRGDALEPIEPWLSMENNGSW
jgi:lactoylglutathione lyase|tara:strand:+ start:863 stop:1267 length:405 start_codon:yes stop_codon:yes gene_type:complete